jgi:hypothetical protein
MPGSSTLCFPEADSLMFNPEGGGGSSSADLYFLPDDTHYIGYDTVTGVFGRPRDVYITRGIHLGGTASGYEPVLELASADSGAAPGLTVNGWIKANFVTDIVGVTKPIEFRSNTVGNALLLYSKKTPGTTVGTSSIAFVVDDADARSGSTDLLMEWGPVIGGTMQAYMSLDGSKQLTVYGLLDL